ncbi:hypothetical protein EJB05_45666 [Eragrostis curvula]|uniref:FAR1 domain-containing protein n=1 Tax=Eragrostis curvula TaxID=38414 RepID=A0A5J9TL74_9POAL|nr:hypothetical protein EJB05_45666 [Eragrostis curvula]
MGTVYSPCCDVHITPKIGMVFSSWEEGEDYYKTYALHAQFCARRGPQKLGEGGSPIWKSFVCSKQGWREMGPARVYRRNMHHSRCGCKAMIRFTAQDDGTIRVSHLVEAHTHIPDEYI